MVQSNQCLDAGNWQACRQMQAWREQGLPPLCLAVNLSSSRFVAPHLVELVTTVLHDTGLEPAALELEITEGVLMKDLEGSAKNMQALKKQGVQLAIDDFGTGYSSLSYLKHLPLDRLKIDMSFVQGVQDHASDRAIARAIVVLGHNLNMTVIAEGIETETQRKILWGYGCETGQGYLFGRPMEPEAFAVLCKSA